MLKYQQNPTAAIAKSTDTGAKQTITDAKHSHASKKNTVTHRKTLCEEVSGKIVPKFP